MTFAADYLFTGAQAVFRGPDKALERTFRYGPTI